MTDRIDHAAEARLALEHAMRDVSANWAVTTGEYKSDIIAQAQVHATLAFVEQQRIANLIAAAAMRDETALTRAAALALVEYPTGAHAYQVQADVAAALGTGLGQR